MQVARYFLGSHHESLHFQLLTGIRQKQHTEYFWPIFTVIIVFCTMMTLLIITIQNTVGRYKEWNLAKNVQINLPEIIGQNEDIGPRGFNTNKYDVSVSHS